MSVPVSVQVSVICIVYLSVCTRLIVILQPPPVANQLPELARSRTVGRGTEGYTRDKYSLRAIRAGGDHVLAHGQQQER